MTIALDRCYWLIQVLYVLYINIYKKRDILSPSVSSYDIFIICFVHRVHCHHCHWDSKDSKPTDNFFLTCHAYSSFISMCDKLMNHTLICQITFTVEFLSLHYCHFSIDESRVLCFFLLFFFLNGHCDMNIVTCPIRIFVGAHVRNRTHPVFYLRTVKLHGRIGESVVFGTIMFTSKHFVTTHHWPRSGIKRPLEE